MLDFADLLKIGIPLLLGILGSVLSYYKGKRTKIIEIKIKKGFEIAEEISFLIHSINEIYDYLIDFYSKNYNSYKYSNKNIENFEDSIETIYSYESKQIDELNRLKEKLSNKRKIINIYSNSKLEIYIHEYLKNDNFKYETGVGFSDFYYSFFKHILDDKVQKKRSELYNRIKNELNSLKF